MLLGCTAVHGIRCCLTPVFLRMYVCVLDTTVSATKMAELIELLFGMWTLWGWKNHALNWGTDPRREGALFQIIFQHAQTLPSVDIVNIICWRAAAMRPVATSTTATCYLWGSVSEMHYHWWCAVVAIQDGKVSVTVWPDAQLFACRRRPAHQSQSAFTAPLVCRCWCRLRQHCLAGRRLCVPLYSRFTTMMWQGNLV